MLSFALLLLVEKAFLLGWLQNAGALSHVYTLLLVVLSFVIFDAGSIPEAFSRLGALFGAGGLPFATAEALYYLRSFAVVFAVDGECEQRTLVHCCRPAWQPVWQAAAWAAG